MTKLLFSCFFFLLVSASFSQTGRTAGTSTLNPTNCPTVSPGSPYDLCITPTATIVPIVHAPPSAQIIYQWMVPAGAGVIGGLNQQNLQTTTGGVYTVVATNANTNCTALQTYVVVDCPVGIEEKDANAVVAVFPNPFKDRLELIAVQNTTLKLFDAVGQLAVTLDLGEGKNSFDLSHLHAGIYYLQLGAGASSRAVKLVKE